MLAGAGGSVVNAVSNGQISRAAAVTAPGLTVLAVILFMGGISGAHLNPAVSIAFATRGNFPWLRVPGYIIAQLVGSTLAVLLLRATFGNVGMLGATEPGPGISDWQAVVVEFVLTAGLVSTILGTASKAQNLGPISAFGVGAYIILAGLWSSPISGASMNLPLLGVPRGPHRGCARRRRHRLHPAGSRRWSVRHRGRAGKTRRDCGGKLN